MAEVLNRVIEKAIRGSAPAQINVPRDFWTQVIDIELPQIVRIWNFPAGGKDAIAARPSFCRMRKLSGHSVRRRRRLGGAIEDCQNSRNVSTPRWLQYQHNDSFPGSHPLACGPLGYNGSKAAMELIAQADVVLALGTRLNPFSTLPGYGIDYWPKDAKHHPGRYQCRPHRPDQEGHRRHCGDARQVARADPRKALAVGRRCGPRRTQGA